MTRVQQAAAQNAGEGILARLVRAAILLALYVVLTKLGLKFAQVTPSSTVVWPGTGLAIAATLLFGYETAPIWLLSAFITNLTTSGAVASSLTIAGGNMAEALAGAWLIRRYAGGVAAFDGPQRTLRALLCIAGAAAISATIGIVAVEPRALIAAGGHAWLVWWWGDLSGAVLIVPFILSWSEWDPRLPRLKMALEIVAFFAVIGVLCAPIFLRAETYALTFLIVFALAWAPMRLGRRVTTTAVLLVAVFAAVMTKYNLGPFTHGGRETALIVMQLFFSSLALTELLIANTVEQRQHLMDARDLFVSATIHELRSPLTTVHGGLQLLARRMNGDEKNSELIRSILGQSARLVDALSNLSETRTSEVVENARGVVDLRDVVSSALQSRAIFDDAIRAVIPDVTVPVLGDPARLEQVLTNLLNNAQKYGGDTPRELELRCDPPAETAMLSVTDFGIGIAPEETEEIFRPYYRTSGAKESGQIGAGLGLHVVRSIVESHGGSISVRSMVGQGSTFEVRLPLARQAELAQADEPPAARPVRPI